MREALLRVAPLVEIVDVLKGKQSLVGIRPYRYDHMDLEAARQLIMLIDEIEKDIRGVALQQPVFAAYSEDDETASPKDLLEFLYRCPRSAPPSTIPRSSNEEEKVAHASVVLEEDIPCERGNPYFVKMMNAVHEFARQHLRGTE